VKRRAAAQPTSPECRSEGVAKTRAAEVRSYEGYLVLYPTGITGKNATQGTGT